MQPTLRLLAPVLAAGALASVSSSQMLICDENFESYSNGENLVDVGSAGTFWFNSWWSNDTTIGGGLGGSTNGLSLQGDDSQAFRLPQTGPWTETIAPGFQFGGDGPGTIWVEFRAQRTGDNTYLGVVLNQQFCCEAAFLGVPFATDEWGVASSLGNATVAGSNPNVETHLVYRIDLMPGDENLSLWLDPATVPPTGTPDLTTTIPDTAWNEIGLKAGGGTTNDVTFDELSITCDGCTAVTADTPSISLSAGGVQNMTISAGNSNQSFLYLMVGSLTGTSPGIPLGTGTLPINFDAYTSFTLASPAPVLSNSFTALDGEGKGFPSFNIPAGIDVTNPVLVGQQANHAYVVFDGAFDLTHVGEAQSCDLLP